MTTTKASFELRGEPRVVDAAVVTLFDEALEKLGGEVLHAIDLRRILSFENGGPAVWSVGMVSVAGKTPYTLLMTYGLSHALSPEDARAGIDHEYSLAVPAHVSPSPWADALLRHMARYVLTRADLAVGDVMPCYLPLTCVPFPPEHHGTMPKTDLVGLVVARDPILPRIGTPRGDVEIRRLMGIEQGELDRIETWSAAGFVEEYAKREPLLLTDLGRATSLADPVFRATVEARAKQEGSVVPAIMVDMAWELDGDALVIEWPGGRDAKKLLDAIRGRVPFGQRLNVFSRRSPPIAFRPASRFDLDWSEDGLMIDGNLDDPHVAQIVGNIRPDSDDGTRFRIAFKS